MFLTLLLAFASVAQGEPGKAIVSLSPPATAAKAGTVVPIGVYFRNDGQEPIELAPPVTFDAQLVTPNTRSPIALTRMKDWPEARSLAPGENVYVEYSIQLPEGTFGRLVLQLERAEAAAAVVDVLEPEVVDGSEAPKESEDQPLNPEAAPVAPEEFTFAQGALQRFSLYEPTYFIGGLDRPNVRYQFSFQYHIFNPEGPWASKTPFLKGFLFGYTQTSLWDLEGESKPFTDTNYRPEVAWSQEELKWLQLPGVAQTGMQFGVQHESNGEDGRLSRSINMFYVRPVLHFGDPKGFEVQVAPKVYAYLPDRDDNPDITEYRGYCDLGVSAGWSDGFKAAAIGRLGSGGENGSIQIDLTYPLSSAGEGNFDLYLQLQWFSGYGESLITYDEYTDALRFGIGFVR